MSLNRFRVSNFRNLTAVEIVPCRGLNLIYGSNASGKTSLLEAIYYLGRASSFRTSKNSQVIERGMKSLTLFGEIGSASGERIPIGLQRSAQSLQLRVAGENARAVSEVASWFPLLLVNPDSHQLLEQGPKLRRQFIDWGVFHVEQSFHTVWSRFRRALKQRNSALRSNSPTAATVWDRELVSSAVEIDAMRVHYIAALSEIVPKFASPLADAESIELIYHPGWDRELGYQTVLQSGFQRDREMGHTRRGPHRADLLIKMAGESVQAHVSRGQQKLLVCALRMAQASLLTQITGKRSIFLLDDLPAELDQAHREALMAQLAELPAQLFITAIEDSLLDTSRWSEYKVFHVERGTVEEVV